MLRSWSIADMQDAGVLEMEVVLIPEMPMSGDLPRLCFKKKMMGAQCLEPLKFREPSI